MELVDVSLEELRRLIEEARENGVEDLSRAYIRALGSGGKPWIIVKEYYVHECGEGCHERIISDD